MNSGPTLGIGATGTDVARLQRLFVEMKMLDFTGIDGSFGPVTDQVVHDFQDGAGLVVDGIVGPGDLGRAPGRPRHAAARERRLGCRGGGAAAGSDGVQHRRSRDRPGRDRRELRPADRVSSARVSRRPRRRRRRRRRGRHVVGAGGRGRCNPCIARRPDDGVEREWHMAVWRVPKAGAMVAGSWWRDSGRVALAARHSLRSARTLSA